MTDQELSPMAQDYVKVVWNAGEWSDTPVTTKHLAERMGVAASTVSENVRKLSDQGLLEHAPYGAITLTLAGTRHALTMVRKHRLIETYLVERLGYTWDEVHDEAEVLEHACSPRMIDAMDRALGYPTRDPHGDPIPTADGALPTPSATLLAHAAAGEWQVARISDADPGLLRHLADIGLTLDADVRVLPVPEFEDGVRLHIANRSDPVSLGAAAAHALWLVPRG
ncbi:MAG: metal-dependent transcriptional regulator [Actinobacteria bacterium HGW-Actinobacteria-4]|nr:MAG: metal-dependent transcriptional regulator [Actinobacteria bacterium HGW-Actinobacteria-4]